MKKARTLINKKEAEDYTGQVHNHDPVQPHPEPARPGYEHEPGGRVQILQVVKFTSKLTTICHQILY